MTVAMTSRCWQRSATRRRRVAAQARKAARHTWRPMLPPLPLLSVEMVPARLLRRRAAACARGRGRRADSPLVPAATFLRVIPAHVRSRRRSECTCPTCNTTREARITHLALILVKSVIVRRIGKFPGDSVPGRFRTMQCGMADLGVPCFALPGLTLHTCTTCERTFHHLCR